MAQFPKSARTHPFADASLASAAPPPSTRGCARRRPPEPRFVPSTLPAPNPAQRCPSAVLRATVAGWVWTASGGKFDQGVSGKLGDVARDNSAATDFLCQGAETGATRT